MSCKLYIVHIDKLYVIKFIIALILLYFLLMDFVFVVLSKAGFLSLVLRCIKRDYPRVPVKTSKDYNSLHAG